MEWKLQSQKPRAELPEYSTKNCCAVLLLVGRTLYRRIISTFLTGFLRKYVSFHWILLEITVFHQFQNAHFLPHFYIVKIRDALYKWWHLTIDWSYDIVVICLYSSELEHSYLYCCHFSWIVCTLGIIWVEFSCHYHVFRKSTLWFDTEKQCTQNGMKTEAGHNLDMKKAKYSLLKKWLQFLIFLQSHNQVLYHVYKRKIPN